MFLKTNTPRSNEKRLLATMTNEPFIPVRLYYMIPNRAFVMVKFRKLKCMSDVPAEKCWQWLFKSEAESLVFAAGINAVPKERRPIVLGRFRFPTETSMILETNSILRAIEGAKFFAARLGSKVVAMRCRLVNRCFAAEEGEPGELLKTLDRDVVVIDPRMSEEAIKRELAGVQSQEDAERAIQESLSRRLASKDDVPLVEDFPLAPEEETPEFVNLANALQFRFLRAFEHWHGNTHLTLSQIIVRTVEDHLRTADAH